MTGYNRRLAKKRVQCLIEALCFVSSSVVVDSFRRQAQKAHLSPY